METDLFKELYDANPHSVQLLEGLGVSYFKLAGVQKELGEMPAAREYFQEWRRIITTLAQNFPDIPKYRGWLQAEL